MEIFQVLIWYASSMIDTICFQKKQREFQYVQI